MPELQSLRLPVIMSLNRLWKRTEIILRPGQAANDNWYSAADMNCIHACRNAECHIFLDFNFAPLSDIKSNLYLILHCVQFIFQLL